MPISNPSSVLLDTNILLRLVTKTNPLHALTASVLVRMANAGITVYVCPQNMQEFRQVATRPLASNGFGWTSEDTANKMSRIEVDYSLLLDTPAVYSSWRHIVETVGATGRANFDARIVAVAEVNRIDAVLTFEAAAFSRYGTLVDVTILDPTTF